MVWYHTFDELSYPSRVKYRWLVDKPAPMLYEEYPAWKQANRLEKPDNTLLYVAAVVAACVVVGAVIVGVKLWKRRLKK